MEKHYKDMKIMIKGEIQDSEVIDSVDGWIEINGLRFTFHHEDIEWGTNEGPMRTTLKRDKFGVNLNDLGTLRREDKDLARILELIYNRAVEPAINKLSLELYVFEKELDLRAGSMETLTKFVEEGKNYIIPRKYRRGGKER